MSSPLEQVVLTNTNILKNSSERELEISLLKRKPLFEKHLYRKLYNSKAISLIHFRKFPKATLGRNDFDFELSIFHYQFCPRFANICIIIYEKDNKFK
jgi:hypothetical protein